MPVSSPSLDTVAVAARTRTGSSPGRELGLKPDEYHRIREILGRRPTSSELAMYSVMWSEHCSYKSSKVHLKQFGEIPQETPVGKLLVGIGENAGVVDIGQGYAVTFKVESHNHPSYVEPYQGAATGVGGIVRDILAMGARPVAVMDPLRFGPLDAPATPSGCCPGSSPASAATATASACRTSAARWSSTRRYHGNPLVNALCVGVMRHEDIHLAKASGAGNQVILYGAAPAATASAASSCSPPRPSSRRRPGQAARASRSATRSWRSCSSSAPSRSSPTELVVGIQDLGGAGLSCATSELATAGDGGMHVELDRVPAARLDARARGDPHERVAGADVAVVEPGERRARSWRSATSGTSTPPSSARSPTATGSTIDWHGETHRRRAPADGRARGPGLRAPVRAARRGRTRCRPTTPSALARPATGDELRDTLLRAGRLAEPVRQVLGHRPVRPLRAGQHRAGAARGRRA